ncbi:MAG: MMPL family transporter [Pseudomonadales bacterium]
MSSATHSAKSWWLRLWLLALTVLGSAAFFGMVSDIWPGIPVRSNIMELLPSLRDDAVLRDALQRSNRAFSQKLLILVGDSDEKTSNAAAEQVLTSIKQHDFFAVPMTGIALEQAKQIGQFYYPWRAGLLSTQQQQWIAANNFSALEKQLTETIYSPVSGINSAMLNHDPLLSFYHFMRALPAPQGNIQSADGHLQVRSENKLFRVIIVDIKPDVFDMSLHPSYSAWRSALQESLHKQFPNSELLLMGAVQHAVWGATSAKREVAIVGNGSLLGVILLMVIVFRGPRALFASLLPLGAGVFAGLVATLLCFREVHIITLVFGSSVIGVAMDYSLHYLTEHYKDSHQLSGRQCLHRVFPGITMAMITSAIAYAAIGFAPFPVLRQIAVFSCAGLFMAWLTVVSFYPSLLAPAQFSHPRYLQWSEKTDHFLCHLFSGRLRRALLIIAALAMLPSVLQIHANDDLHLLQTPDAGITAMEKRVQALTGLQPSTQFFLLEGSTPEKLLQHSEQLRAWLKQAQPNAALDSLSNYLPSQKTQQENFSAQQILYQDFVTRWRETLGLSDNTITEAATLFQQTPAHWLSVDAVSQSPLVDTLTRFQLAQTERGWIAAAFVRNSTDLAALKQYAAANDGVHWMDPVSDISQLFHHYREQTGWMMLIAYAVIAALLCWRYRFAQAWRVMLAPALAAWFTLGLLGYAGVALNLFHVLALLLVLGVGIDYSIFFAESDTQRDTTMLAVLLSTATTLLSFGLLALSQTAAISSFGIVISIGLVCSLLFSPLAQHRQFQR